MKKLLTLFSGAALVCAIFTSCVSIFGTYKKVHIRSTPLGASIYRDDGKYIGQTPFLYKGKAHHNFYLSMNGYEDASIYTESKFNPLYLANVILMPYGFFEFNNATTFKKKESYYNVTMISKPTQKYNPSYTTSPSRSSSTYSSGSTYSPGLNSGSIQSNERIYGSYLYYKETDDCVEGVVVYEGEDDYYIVETKRGYTILERYSGSLYEGNRVRGELNRYGSKYLINRNNNSEVKVYIEDYALSDDDAVEWMGKNKHLNNRDQEAYDRNN